MQHLIYILDVFIDQLQILVNDEKSFLTDIKLITIYILWLRNLFHSALLEYNYKV